MRRVVITGMGVVSPIGNTKTEFFLSLAAGANGIGPVTLFDASTFPVRFAGEVKNFDIGQIKSGTPELNKITDRKVFLGYQAAQDALTDSGLAGPLGTAGPGLELGLNLGVSLESVRLEDIASMKISPSGLRVQTPLDTLSTILIQKFKLKGNSFVNCSACTASAQAIGHSFQQIRTGQADAVLAGGYDSMLNPLGIGGFALLGALSMKNETPEKASRPFDCMRDGAVLGEGAAMFVVEELGRAQKRGAYIYAEILGYGSSLDAYKATDPHPAGAGAASSMNRALRDGGLSPQNIHYINAHGTSTPKNDKAETEAVKKVFGSYAYKVPISSTKSMTGHLIAAAGAVEVGACLFAIEKNMIPPTINYQYPDPECDLDYTPNHAVPWYGDNIMTCSFGFGGQNSALIISRHKK